MTERPFILLTQDDCPNCERLKKMLAGPLGGAFDEKIEVIHRQSSPQRFSELAQTHRVQSLPALVHHRGAVLLKTSGLGEVQRFLVGEVPKL
ncbi:thioredoxin fold domain-containing protein [Deinococcus sp.]|uniref:thioredoxin fold domain-containing protein n=1 Tax=Deinococcus sp. TaxID=47478 RepID=UPI0025C70C24|nr:thioredoxin fold domain-containing protein [Deinococcus sp.]